jgi:DNA-binding CsgD family transcriptional regulator
MSSIGIQSARHPDAQIDYLRLALAFKALNAGLWDYDLDTDVFNCSERLYEILGVEERLTPIRSIRAFSRHIHPDDAQEALEAGMDDVSNRLADEEIFHVDFRIIRPIGEIRWMRSIACFTLDSSTGSRRVIGCVADITEFRQFESDSKRSASTLGSPANLSQKEVECLTWVSLGKTASESGMILGKSSRTVEFHINNAVRKLGVVNKIHAVAIAIRMGLI